MYANIPKITPPVVKLSCLDLKDGTCSVSKIMIQVHNEPPHINAGT